MFRCLAHWFTGFTLSQGVSQKLILFCFMPLNLQIALSLPHHHHLHLDLCILPNLTQGDG